MSSQKTGSGGVGTYGLSKSSTTVSETITTTAVAPLVTYDSLSGAFIVTSGTTGATSTVSYGSGTTADALNLTAADGAVLSQGAAAAVPAAAMATTVVGATKPSRSGAATMTAWEARRRWARIARKSASK